MKLSDLKRISIAELVNDANIDDMFIVNRVTNDDNGQHLEKIMIPAASIASKEDTSIIAEQSTQLIKIVDALTKKLTQTNKIISELDKKLTYLDALQAELTEKIAKIDKLIDNEILTV